jgi:succinate dehydrogenase hydrophobic anchor subunit
VAPVVLTTVPDLTVVTDIYGRLTALITAVAVVVVVIIHIVLQAVWAAVVAQETKEQIIEVVAAEPVTKTKAVRVAVAVLLLSPTFHQSNAYQAARLHQPVQAYLLAGSIRLLATVHSRGSKDTICLLSNSKTSLALFHGQALRS